ncbi:MAG TPA: SagB family peptide dehydrogenase [Candidatus Dormibacteraeota bacterium]|nr:SagB family peptide dehydrogenase [Candidatus Dormibacteraeota bacterium]
MQPGVAAREFHQATKHTRQHLVGGGMIPLGAARRPPQFKGYVGGELLAPLDGPPPLTLPVLTALAGAAPLDARLPTRADLERLCHLANGVLRWRQLDSGPLGFRAAPCTGALYHVELYLACADLDGLPAGLYHHDPGGPGLRRLRGGDQRAIAVEAAAAEPALAAAPVVVLLTSAFWRNAWKYGPRAYRHTYWDGGVVLANVLAAAQALGLPALLVLGFADDQVARLLDLDSEREAPFALVALGGGGPAAAGAPAPTPLDIEDEPLFAPAEHFAAIPAAHAATSLTSDDVRAWRAAAPAPKRWTAIQHGSANAGPTIEEAIVGRRSTRSFAGSSISQGQLRLLLHASLAPVPADVAVDPGAVHLVVSAVEGLEPGLYRVDGGRPVLVRARGEAELRRAAHRMALGQELAATAAVNVCFLADLADVLGRLGDRGWRAAHLGASIAAGRLEVAAEAHGLGATGLTFYDDEVVELFGLDPERTAVTYLAAVGVPWRPGMPSGLPDRPANLALRGDAEPEGWELNRYGSVTLEQEPTGLRMTLGPDSRLLLEQAFGAAPALGGRVRMTADLGAECVGEGAVATLGLRVDGARRPLDRDSVELRADGARDARLEVAVPPRARGIRMELTAKGPGTFRLGALALELDR